MSAIAAIVSRDGAPVDTGRLNQLQSGLQHYGHVSTVTGATGVGIVLRSHDPAAYGTPPGPLRVERDGIVFGFCGRIDNRQTVLTSLAETCSGPAAQSDLEIAASLYLKNGPQGLGVICGGFVLVAHHEAEGVTRVVRDPLGDQPLYYHDGPRTFIAASEAGLVQRVAGLAPEPDPVRITAWLCNTWPAMDRTFFRGVRELLPGHYLDVSAKGVICRQYWQFSPRADVVEMTDVAVQELFRATLKEVVGDQTSQLSGAALSLSGGLDSASIAASSSEACSLTGYSWTFCDHPEHDEGSQVQLLSEAVGLPVTYVEGSDAYCRFDRGLRGDGVSYNGPHTNTVTRLKTTLYRAASDAGHSVILAGDSADELYLCRHYWLRDLIRFNRSGQAARALPAALTRLAQGQPDSWLPLRLLAGTRFGLRRYLPDPDPGWLTGFAKTHQTGWAPSPLVPANLREEVHNDYALGQYRSSYMTYELEHIARLGIERRCPYRDLRIVILLLSLPAWHYSLPPRNKVLVRDAFADWLPPQISAADKRGSLSFLLVKGLVENRASLIAYLRRNTDWQEYLDGQLIVSALDRLTSAGQNPQVPDGVIWNAICLQTWIDLLKADIVTRR